MDNNAYLEQIAGVEPGSGLTNNQLLEIIAENGGGGGGGGESSYDAVVPSTDYPTLESAVAAGKTNIFMKAGVHTLGESISITNPTEITGLFLQTIISLGDFNITSDATLTLNGLYFAADAGYVRLNGDNCTLTHNAFVKSEGVTGSVLRVNSQHNFIDNNMFMKQGDDRTTPFIEIWKANSVFSNNIVTLRDAGNTIQKAALSLTDSPYSVRIVGNRFITNQADPWSSDAVIIGLTHADGVIDGNYFENLTNGGTAIVCDDYDEVITNNRSYAMANLFTASNATAQYRRTYTISNNLVMLGHLTQGNFHDSTVTNNYISHTSPLTWANIEGVIVTGNQFRNCGLTLDTTALNCIVTNNTLYNATASYANTLTDNGTGNTTTPNISGRTAL